MFYRSDDTDPFRIALSSNPLTPPEQHFRQTLFNVPIGTDSVPDKSALHEIAEEVPIEDFLFEPDEAPFIQEAEMESLLSEDK